MKQNVGKRTRSAWSCYRNYSTSITSPGIYGWGSTEYGQLGQGDKIKQMEKIQSLQFSTMNFDISDYKMAIAMEKNSLFLIKKDNKEFLYSVGSGGGSVGFECDEPQFHPVFLQDIDCEAVFKSPIKKIEPGRFHLLIVTEKNELFGLGSNRVGQLGFQESKNFLVPVKIPIENVKQAVGGCFHSMVLTMDGKFYSWGENIYGQLGHGNMENVFEPKLLKDFPSNIRCFDTYAFHSLAVTEDNRLLGWGGNKYSQIKTSPTKMFFKPVEIPHTIKSPIVDVKCGSTHSLLLTADGDIYAWGKNSQSQLGQDFIFADSCGTPSPIAAPKDTFFDQIIAACDFNFAKTKEGALYGWGLAADYTIADVASSECKAPTLLSVINPDLEWKNLSARWYHLLALVNNKK